jgi:hypothetical protein
VKKLAWALLISSALPACVLIQPLDDSKPDSAGGSSQNSEGGDGNSAAGKGTAGGSPSGGSGVTPSGGEGDTGPSGGAAPSGGAVGTGGKAPTAGAGGTTAGTGGRAPTAGAGGTAGSTATGPYCTAAVTPCGGNLVGTWTFQSSCITLPTTDPTLPTECQGISGFLDYSFTGTVTFDGTSEEIDVTEQIDQTLKYTTACISALHDSHPTSVAPPASTTSCPMIASNLATSSSIDAYCPYSAANGGTCNCALVISGSGTTTDDYTISGTGQFVTASEPDYPWTYCVSGNTLTVSQSDADGNVFQHVLTKTAGGA